ncbi:hypothetical protein I7I48_11155 [Histoplasma ohiense]|nr:hypothetical protein I7I48_11155 [Histoplasma ohiense (nom. inval.)]
MLRETMNMYCTTLAYLPYPMLAIQSSRIHTISVSLHVRNTIRHLVAVQEARICSPGAYLAPAPTATPLTTQI